MKKIDEIRKLLEKGGFKEAKIRRGAVVQAGFAIREVNAKLFVIRHRLLPDLHNGMVDRVPVLQAYIGRLGLLPCSFGTCFYLCARGSGCSSGETNSHVCVRLG